MNPIIKSMVLISCLLLAACGGGGGAVEPPVACTMDVKQCPDGSFVGRVAPSCEFAPCPNEILFDTSCSSDADCTLINSRYGYGCCWSGACDPIDYSKAEWIAVNASWFNSERTRFCPPQGSCGPSPLCPMVIVNDRFRAACADRVCSKVPVK